jgi:hypothetical protein
VKFRVEAPRPDAFRHPAVAVRSELVKSRAIRPLVERLHAGRPPGILGSRRAYRALAPSGRRFRNSTKS